MAIGGSFPLTIAPQTSGAFDKPIQHPLLRPPGRQRGLAVVAAPVYGQHGGTAGTALVRSPPGHRVDDRAQQLHAPRSGFGLFRG